MENVMENESKFLSVIKENLKINNFEFCCIFNDVFLQNYNYTPRYNKINKIIYEWVHNTTQEVISLTDIRIYLTTTLRMRFYRLNDSYLNDLCNVESDSREFKILKDKSNKIFEFSIMLEKGDIYKEFVDCYKNSYLV